MGLRYKKSPNTLGKRVKDFGLSALSISRARQMQSLAKDFTSEDGTPLNKMQFYHLLKNPPPRNKRQQFLLIRVV